MKNHSKENSPLLDRFAKVASWALRLFFVPKCVICKDLLEKDGELCSECRNIWSEARRRRCPVCQKTARACRCRAFSLVYTDMIGDRRISSLAFYGKFGSEDICDLLVRRLVFAVKKDPDRSAVRLVGRELAHEIIRTLYLAGEDPKDWKLTYPPRSKKRIKKYGFDQGKDMAKMISRYTGMKVESTLVNIGNSTQKSLNAIERRTNAEHSYMLKKDLSPKGNYIIIDDVITTGATVNNAAYLLKSAGADKVYPVCIARIKNKKRRVRRPAEKPWFQSKSP